MTAQFGAAVYRSSPVVGAYVGQVGNLRPKVNRPGERSSPARLAHLSRQTTAHVL
jgi:hypothetical protein